MRRFRKIKQIIIVKFKIVLNNPCQFSAHTWITVTFNMHVSFMSIGFLVTDLRFLAMRISNYLSRGTFIHNKVLTKALVYYIEASELY